MNRRPLLILTPATRFGSWAWIEKALARRPEVPVVVVGYGRSKTAPPHVRFVTLPPIVDYGTWGARLAERRYLALNLLYYAPLVPLAWFVAVRHRPRVVLANGVNAAAILAPLTWFGSRLVLAYHGSIEHAGDRWHRLLRRVLAPVDLAFVNSAGSADDLAHVVDRERIEVVEHWADTVFFQTPLARPVRGPLRVLYVGRLDEEKFAQCLRVCEPLAADGTLELTAVGIGPLAPRTGAGVRALGYVADKNRLAEIYAEADVVWAPADVTYVSIPGAEGLASGCPLVISARPAVFPHARRGLKVPRGLVPEGLGEVVDGDAEAESYLRGLARDGIDLETRARCRAYAGDRYSERNLDRVSAELAGERRV